MTGFIIHNNPMATMNIHQPIIVIGAGRSGTTLLTRIFDKHPDIDFRGETSFLLPRLWLELWEDRFWLNWQEYTNSNPASACEEFPKIPDAVLEEHQQRVGQILAKVMTDTLKIETNKYKVWGYKEIWNGSSFARYNWKPYDITFPEAIWVHIVRNPFDFAKSCSNWNKTIFSVQLLKNFLQNWVSIHQYSKEKSTTGRYFLLKYEDILKEPDNSLKSILDRVGLKWHPNCNEAIGKRVLQSCRSKEKPSYDEVSIDEVNNAINEVTGLTDLMDELGYNVPQGIEKQLRHSQQPGQQEVINLHIQHTKITQPHQPQYVISQLQQEYLRLQDSHTQLQASHTQLQASHTQLQASHTQLLDNGYVRFGLKVNGLIKKILKKNQ